ncbi:fimbrin, partial [Coemansia sp. RSA 2681]
MSQQDFQRLSKKFPILKPWDVESIAGKFTNCGLDVNGGLENRKLLAAVNEVEPEHQRQYDEVHGKLKEVDVSRSGMVELDEFVELVARLRMADKEQQQQSSSNKAPAATAKAFEGITSDRAYTGRTVLGSRQNASSAHTINEDEREEFANHINFALSGDADIG